MQNKKSEATLFVLILPNFMSYLMQKPSLRNLVRADNEKTDNKTAVIFGNVGLT
jgi:hypothetical protein